MTTQAVTQAANSAESTHALLLNLDDIENGLIGQFDRLAALFVAIRADMLEERADAMNLIEIGITLARDYSDDVNALVSEARAHIQVAA